MSHNSVSIKLVPGKIAPRYTDNEKQLDLKEVVITEQGTEGDLPLIDFILTDAEGKEYFFMVTGRIVAGIAHAISGVNMRNHGKLEP